MMFDDATVQLSRADRRRTETNPIVTRQFNVCRVPRGERTEMFRLQVDRSVDDLQRQTMKTFERKTFRLNRMTQRAVNDFRYGVETGIGDVPRENSTNVRMRKMTGQNDSFVQMIQIFVGPVLRFQTKIFRNLHRLFEDRIERIQRWTVNAT